MVPSIGKRAGAMLRIRLHQEAAEVRDMIINLIRRILPPLPNLIAQRIGGRYAADMRGAAKLMLKYNEMPYSRKISATFAIVGKYSAVMNFVSISCTLTLLMEMAFSPTEANKRA